MTNHTSNDEQLRRQVVAELERGPDIHATRVGVAVENGVVTLTGHVNSCRQKGNAADAALRVNGVQAVLQEMTVRPPRGLGSAHEEIARRTLEAIRWDAEIPDGWVKPVVDHGLVTLKGEVDTQHQRAKTEDVLRIVNGIIDIYNHITLRGRPEPRDVTRRIEAALQRDAATEAASILVTCQGDRVVLDGYVRSQSELNTLEDAVRATPGVNSVENRVKIGEPAGRPKSQTDMPYQQLVSGPELSECHREKTLELKLSIPPLSQPSST